MDVQRGTMYQSLRQSLQLVRNDKRCRYVYLITRGIKNRCRTEKHPRWGVRVGRETPQWAERLREWIVASRPWRGLSSATDTARPLLLDVNKFDRDLAACTGRPFPNDWSTGLSYCNVLGCHLMYVHCAVPVAISSDLPLIVTSISL